MGNIGFNFSWGSSTLASAERDRQGNWFYRLLGGSNVSRIPDSQKIKTVKENPALLSAVSLNADLMSLGRVHLYDKDNKPTQLDYLKQIKPKPNYFQSWEQFFWDYVFFIQTFGVAIMRKNSNDFKSENNPLYWLNPACLNFSSEQKKLFSRMHRSKSDYDKLMLQRVDYNNDGVKESILMSDLLFLYDTTNGTGSNYFTGISKIDALYKVINNNELSLDANANNLFYSGQFMATGVTEASDISSPMMGEPEKQSVESSLKTDKGIHVTQTPIDVKRFVENRDRQKLDDAYWNTYLAICIVLNIPREVSEAYIKTGNYKDKETALVRHVEYAILPKANNLISTFETTFNLKGIKMDFKHLSMYQVVEVERAEKQSKQLENLKIAKELGMSDADVINKLTEIMG